MKERPILFSGPMVQAIMEGRKTQTRRVINLPPAPNRLGSWEPFNFDPAGLKDDRGNACTIPAQQGIWHTRTGQSFLYRVGPGDRLWVRESFMQPPVITQKMMHDGADTWPSFVYFADESCFDIDQWKQWGWKSKPSIFMPRCASRITLEITGIRVQRLKDISVEDALAEGVSDYTDENEVWAYAQLWNSINGKKCPWSSNPWVWVIEFERIME